MRKLILGCIFLSICVIVSCDNSNTETSTQEDENFVKPTQDPHDVKPMALMMRTMANYCDSIRIKINKGESVDSIAFPLMPFWKAEPTDTSVLETLFYNHAENFATAYRTLMSSKENQRENYTVVINSCINCHSSYCGGPIKRIKKLSL